MARSAFVTGGSGFIGGRLIRRLVKDRWLVRALARSDSAEQAVAGLGAEQAVRDANREGFETVVLRPRFVWGAGDTTLLPEMVSMVKAGRFVWVGGGGQLTATPRSRTWSRG